LQSIHFGFAIGAFVGPILAGPFLSTRLNIETNSSMLNATMLSTKTEIREGSLTIFHLFPILGCISCIVSLAYLAFEIIEIHQRKHKRRVKPSPTEQPIQQKSMNSSLPDTEKTQKYTAYTWMFMITMLVFFIFYVGIEASLTSLLPAFSVNSKLQLTQQDGTMVASLFWITFAAMRLVYIFVPEKVEKAFAQSVCFSLVVMCIGSIGLSILSNHSKLYLSIFTAVTGLGCGPLFGNFVMWLEHHVTVNGKVCAMITVFGSIGGSLIPTLIGQIISDTPMFLMYFQVGLSIILLLLFGSSCLLGSKIRSTKEKVSDI
jgi:fucose permease